MKKIIYVLMLVTLLVGGCIETSIDKVKEEMVDLGVGEYTMKVGDKVTVDNKPVVLESFNADYVTVFDVDGAKREIRETQDAQIINGLELTIKRFNFDVGNIAENSVNVNIVRFIPGADEYLFYLKDVKTILGRKVELIDIKKDDTIVIRVDTLNEKRIMDGKTEAIASLYVSNVNPKYRAIASERYVIVKVVEQP